MRDFSIATYEWQGETRYDVGNHAFLTATEARRLAHNILTAVRMTEMTRPRRPEQVPEGATVGEVDAS